MSVPHRFVLSYVYELPFGRGRRFLSNAGGAVDAILGGWALGGIFSAVAGTPVHLSVQGNPSNSGGADRPNVVGEWRLDRDERTLQRWFNPRFGATPSSWGNAGRTCCRARHHRFDFALYSRSTGPSASACSSGPRRLTSQHAAVRPAQLAVGNPNFASSRVGRLATCNSV